MALYAAELDNLADQLNAIEALAAQQGLSAPSPNAGLHLLTTYAQTFDPGAQAFNPETLNAFKDERNGRARGFGFILCSSGSSFAVKGYLEDAPAAGSIPTQALLTHLGTNPLHQLSFCGLQSLIRQANADRTTLRYLAEDGTSNSVEVTAGDLQLPSIALAEELPAGLAYLRLNGLYTGCSREVVSKIRSWSETDCYGFILDLRNAGGTDEEAVQSIASLFASEGSFLFSFRDRNDQDLSVFKAHAGGPITPAVMVLIDERTTGASELLAAVLSGSAQRTLIIGTPSAGDPLIREAVALDDNLMLYLASKKVVAEDGTVLDAGHRLTPDIPIESTSNRSPYEPARSIGKELLPEEIEDRMIRDRVRNDPPLRRAVDLLLGLKALNIQPPERP
jgi:C-terminal processing protease CtpA/Prc